MITSHMHYVCCKHPKTGGDGRIRTYSPERTDLQSAATLQLSRIPLTFLPYQSVIYQFVNNVASTHKRIAVISGPIPRTVRPA